MKAIKYFMLPLILSVLVIGCAKEEKPPANLNLDQQAGWKIYKAKNCRNCHTIGDSGGKSGPNLTHVASRRDVKYFIELLKNPKAINKKSRMPQPRLDDEQIKFLVEYMKTLK